MRAGSALSVVNVWTLPECVCVGLSVSMGCLSRPAHGPALFWDWGVAVLCQVPPTCARHLQLHHHLMQVPSMTVCPDRCAHDVAPQARTVAPHRAAVQHFGAPLMISAWREIVRTAAPHVAGCVWRNVGL